MNAVLLSGGIDSVALAYWHRPAVVITVDYGQVAAPAEVRAAAAIAAALNIRHEVIRADCSAVGCGDMAPSRRAALNAAPSPEWWPYRNQLVVTLAAARAVALGVRTLLIGTVRSDSRFADGRPEFMEALNRLLSVQEGRLGLTAPAIALSSADLVRVSGVPLDLLAWSHSCHVSENACGRCRSIAQRLRREAMERVEAEYLRAGRDLQTLRERKPDAHAGKRTGPDRHRNTRQIFECTPLEQLLHERRQRFGLRACRIIGREVRDHPAVKRRERSAHRTERRVDRKRQLFAHTIWQTSSNAGRGDRGKTPEGSP